MDLGIRTKRDNSPSQKEFRCSTKLSDKTKSIENLSCLPLESAQTSIPAAIWIVHPSIRFAKGPRQEDGRQ